MNIKLKNTKRFWSPSFKRYCNILVDEIKKKISNLKSKEFVLKAQIHAGGRGKVALS